MPLGTFVTGNIDSFIIQIYRSHIYPRVLTPLPEPENAHKIRRQRSRAAEYTTRSAALAKLVFHQRYEFFERQNTPGMTRFNIDPLFAVRAFFKPDPYVFANIPDSTHKTYPCGVKISGTASFSSTRLRPLSIPAEV